MAMGMVENLGRRTIGGLDAFGDFCIFSGRAVGWSFAGWLRRNNLRLLMEQLFAVGTRSVPVVMIVGAFVGAVLAVQAVMQFRSVGYEAAMGSVVNLSVLRELGPVLAAIILAGRVGGGLTAEIGTMRVTEQIDALRAMGSDPIRTLVVPRFLACVLLIPTLVLYADFMGILGGYGVSVGIYQVSGTDFWQNSANAVQSFDIFYGLIKSVFFGASISLICCYKGFTCSPGAAGVGKACTQSFVACCIAILTLDFFLGVLLNAIQRLTVGVAPILG